MKWKKKTYRRDKMCLCCGEEEKCKLTVHHIMPKSIYAELISEPSNLVVLCQSCHSFLHEVVCNDDLSKCNHKALEILYTLKGTLKGKRGRQKAKYRKW